VRRRWSIAAVGVVAAVLLVVLVSPHASPAPDGLERVAADEGFLDTASGRAGGLEYGPVTGVIGVVVVFALAAGAIALARRRRSRA
jgi:hypothetical protein